MWNPKRNGLDWSAKCRKRSGQEERPEEVGYGHKGLDYNLKPFQVVSKEIKVIKDTFQK